ncbi:hypothetical protein EJ04DRAFT_560990 [Polyplosphaeria fusca]|uniref:Uncharacterized protein n=1 Tax=Polyplosphaeria fusca TaxID=682080 RepID=A0A9P4V349_9PLEO|nr:hypothetical protein EJ04DRAFT_560990 [Polyplosphaeria fusca]
MVCTIAFNLTTATRDTVLEKNLRKKSPQIQAIRQSLGFRELPSSPSWARFVSADVGDLYRGIETLARTIPFEDLEDIYRKFRNGSKSTEVLELLEAYGDRIWCRNKDRSHLFEAGTKNVFYPTDLFIDQPAHKSYIQLQLEHIVFARAEHRRKNHFGSVVNTPIRGVEIENATPSTQVNKKRLSSDSAEKSTRPVKHIKDHSPRL